MEKKKQKHQVHKAKLICGSNPVPAHYPLVTYCFWVFFNHYLVIASAAHIVELEKQRILARLLRKDDVQIHETSIFWGEDICNI